jgi:hypothetical protein
MKLGCLISLAIYSALVAGYRWWLGDRLDAPASWIVPCVVALFACGGLGAIWNAWLAAKASRAVRWARDGLTPTDGRWSAVAGKIFAMGQPLISPFRSTPCVVYEYEIGSMHTDSDGHEKRDVDFGGVAMTPCRVQGANGTVRVIGMPDLKSIHDKECIGPLARRRAMRWVYQTAWENCQGAGVLRGMGSMWRGLTNEDDSFRNDWRMIGEEKCDWLATDWTKDEDLSLARERALYADEADGDGDEDEDENGDDGNQFDREIPGTTPTRALTDDASGDASEYAKANSQYYATPYEKCVPEGAEVVVLGRYDEMQSALVTNAGRGGQMIQIYFGDAASVADELGGSKWRRLFGGLITLALVHAALYGGMELYKRAPKAKFKNIQELRDAVQKSDLPAVREMLERGAPADGETSIGHTLLMDADNGEMAQLLIDHGASLETTDQYGNTALMYAAKGDHVEVVRAILAAGANVDFENPQFGNTALVYAQQRHSRRAIEALLQSGARDDVATEKNGEPIDETHPAFGVVRDYIAAIHAGDAKTMISLFPKLRKMGIRPKDFDEWKTVRPLRPQIVSAYVRGDDATITVAGQAPAGDVQRWILQLKRIAGKWELVREHWDVD